MVSRALLVDECCAWTKSTSSVKGEELDQLLPNIPKVAPPKAAKVARIQKLHPPTPDIFQSNWYLKHSGVGMLPR